MNPRITIGFLGNCLYDTRTFNLIGSLKARDYDVRFFGFDWLTPDFKTYKNGSITVYRLHKRKPSFLFYLKYAFILTWQLMIQRSDIIWAADFFALPLCFVAAKWHCARLLYDSREVYTGISGFNDKPLIRKMVQRIEGFIVRRADAVFTTGPKDSEFIESLYDIPPTYLLRNLPMPAREIAPVDYEERYGFSAEGFKLLYQGALVRGRGIEACLDLMRDHEQHGLILLGGGEHEFQFKEIAKEYGIEDRVLFAGKVAQTELLAYTAGADVGLSLIDNISQNNEFALPNKLFEYIMAGIPSIVTDLPQMREIVEKYKIGAVVPENDIEAVRCILESWKNPAVYARLRENCRNASESLNWQAEFITIEHLFCPGAR